MQETPVCFRCNEHVRAVDAVFEAPCGHDDHSSAVFHGMCLMEWREYREDAFRHIRQFMAEHFGAHEAEGDNTDG